MSAASSAVQTAAASAASRVDRAFAWLLGLHGLALLVVFPLGPQEARLWHPGVAGVCALAAAFPLAAALAGLIARRLPRLPSRPATLAALAFLGTLPGLLSFDYPSFVVARLLGGAVAGLSYAAIHRVLPPRAGPLVSRLAPRIVAFGMPLCLLLSTALDWRFGFLPLLLGQAALAIGFRSLAAPPLLATSSLRESAPAGLVATAALAFVSAAYLCVLSGFLVFNAGHTEWHIPAGLLLGALLGLAVPGAVALLRRRFAPLPTFGLSLGFAALSLLLLLLLRTPQPVLLAVGPIGLFVAASAARHLTLAQLVLPRLAAADLPAHQTHTHLAHHLGMGLGALTAGRLISLDPTHQLAGMPALLGVCLLATAAAFAAGLAAARQASAQATPHTTTLSPAEPPAVTATEARAPL